MLTVTGVDCGVGERVKCGCSEMVWTQHEKRVHEGKIEGDVKGRPIVKCISEVDKYWRKGVGERGIDYT